MNIRFVKSKIVGYYRSGKNILKRRKQNKQRIIAEKKPWLKNSDIIARNEKILKELKENGNSVKVLDNVDCCGCGACFNICPTNAISMLPNKEGFLYPVIDEDKCVHCGMCVKACPSVNTVYENTTTPDVYATRAEEEVRNASSSGGMFSVLADYVFEKGGVICGSAYNENLVAQHIVISDKKDMVKLRGSKYVQSDTLEVYKECKEALDNGKPVLFTGCPCQIAGLKSYLGNKEYEQLYTCDLICHGVPSPKTFRKYLEDMYPGKRIKDVAFRDKSTFGWSTEMNVYFKDGTKYAQNHIYDPYYKAFLPCLGMRPFCSHCKFTTLPRQADFSIGDFWGIGQYNKKLNDRVGTSLVLVNNDKARKIFKELEENMPVVEPMPIETARPRNFTIDRPFKAHPNRKHFFEMLDLAKFDKAVEYGLNNKYDAAIIGLWYGRNYGSIMTYYALNRALSDMGLSVLMVENPYANVKRTDKWADDIAPSRTFADKHYNISTRRPIHQLKELNKYCDSFIVGSDQLWNYGLSKPYGQMYFLDFANDDKKKISYATSFGKNRYIGNESQRLLTSTNMKRFDAISVREDYAVNLCKNKFGYKGAVQVLDPVFICDRQYYYDLIEDATAKEDEKYILSYILDPDKEKGDCLTEAANRYDKKVNVILNDAPWDYERNTKAFELASDANIDIKGKLQPEDWLWYFNNAEFIITDSFHGCCFAILLKKKFVGIINNKRGGDRFKFLLGKLGLLDRLVENASEIKDRPGLNEDIDYDKVYQIIESERVKSLKWLKDALFSNKETDGLSVYKKIDKQLAKTNVDINVKTVGEDCTGCGACFNKCPTNAIKIKENEEGFLRPFISKEKCVECKLCRSVCPALGYKKNNSSTPDCYAAIAEDEIRKDSSSGGIFTLLAEEYIDNGGYVCGAAYEKADVVKHNIVDNKSDLKKLKGSKYVQSDTNDVFKQIKTLLLQGKKVMFTGCPCQVAGLQKFLEVPYENLLTVDLVCHGVPSRKLLSKYLKDCFSDKTIKEIRFRNKENGYNCTNAIVEFTDGTSENVSIKNDSYQKAFHKAIAYSDACYNCQYASLPRIADVTIGDFWGISEFDMSLNDGLGTSLVLLNNNKGKRAFNLVKDKLKVSASVPYSFAVSKNSFSQSRYKPVARRRVYELIEKYNFDKGVDYALRNFYDVGLIGLWYGRNYGSMMTYYALHSVLTRMGKEVLMIDNPLRPSGENTFDKYHPRTFARKYYKVSNKYSVDGLKALNSHIKNYMVGSDQLWNYHLSRPYKQMYYLGFAGEDNKRIAYGTSFGVAKYNGPEDYLEVAKENLKKFSSVSVRDDSAVEICKETFGVDAIKVLDPVFLCEQEDYKVALNDSTINTDGKYICAYILDPSEELIDALIYLTEKTGLKIRIALDEAPTKYNDNKNRLARAAEHENITIEPHLVVNDWLALFENSEFVFTDSFHGCCFGIIFEKNFIGVVNKNRGSQRFLSLVKTFGLESRIVDSPLDIKNDESLFDNIDYEQVNKLKDNEKQKSIDWLKNALDD